MLMRDRIDDAERNAHPTLGSGHTKRVARRRGLIHKALSHNHKNPEIQSTIGAQPLVERRRCQPKGFDCTWAYYGRDADDQLCNGNATGSRFSGDRTSYRSFQASKRLRGLAGRSSALEHPGRSIAARAHDSKWHSSEFGSPRDPRPVTVLLSPCSTPC